jgi:hypothetical protein
LRRKWRRVSLSLSSLRGSFEERSKFLVRISELENVLLTFRNIWFRFVAGDVVDNTSLVVLPYAIKFILRLVFYDSCMLWINGLRLLFFF